MPPSAVTDASNRTAGSAGREEPPAAAGDGAGADGPRGRRAPRRASRARSAGPCQARRARRRGRLRERAVPGPRPRATRAAGRRARLRDRAAGRAGADPPGLYAEAASAGREEALWLAFLDRALSPLAGDDGPFATIDDVRTTWASGEPPRLEDDAVLGPRTSVDPRRPTTTAEAYRAWAARAGSQSAAIAGEPGWTPERRFSRLYERLALPGFTRAGRVELLISLGRLGLAEIEPAELRLGADGSDAATIAAKRVFGIGDAFLLERRSSDLAAAADVPLSALDLALFNFGQPEDRRATMGSRAEPEAALRTRVEQALGLSAQTD
jgi:hypothetical protein